MNKINKTVFLAILVMATLLLAACMPAATMYVCPDGSSVSNVAQCRAQVPDQAAQNTASSSSTIKPAETPASSSGQDAVVKDKELTPDAKVLLDKMAKVTTVKFNYYTSSDPTVQDKYIVSKYRMKVELVNKVFFTPKELYDTIYLDFRNQDAAGYCERQSSETCSNKDKRYEVSYDDYKIRTPFQWYDLIEEASLTGRSKQVEGKTAKELNFKVDGIEGKIWVDSYYGVPLEVEHAGETYKFENMYINDAKEADTYHPSLS